MSQAEVCRQMTARTGRTWLQQTIARIEAGRQAPQLGEAAELASAVGADLAVMMGPPAAARDAWHLMTAARTARAEHAEMTRAAAQLERAREACAHYIARIEAAGEAQALAAEIEMARSALKDTEG